MRPTGIRYRLMAVALAVAAIGAACGGSDPQDSAGSQDSTETAVTTDQGGGDDAQVDGPVDIGELDATSGPGSLVVALADVLVDSADLGLDWQILSQVIPDFDSCEFLNGEGMVRHDYVNLETNNSLSLAVTMYADEAQAMETLAASASERYNACAEESFAFFAAQAKEVGVWDITTDDPVGEMQAESLLPDEDAYTRRYQLSAVGGGPSWELDVASTVVRIGRVIVVIELAVDEGDHGEMTREIRSLLGTIPQEIPPDPALDASVDQLRRAVLGPDTPAEFYSLTTAGLLGPGSESTCGAFGSATSHLHGPYWATANGASGLRQEGWTFPDETTASEALAEVENADRDCLSDVVADRLYGEVEQVDTDFSWNEIGGRQVATVTLNLVQRVGVDETVEADVIVIYAFTQIGAEVVGWEFLGIAGDEPDVVGLTAEAAANVERSR